MCVFCLKQQLYKVFAMCNRRDALKLIQQDWILDEVKYNRNADINILNWRVILFKDWQVRKISFNNF